MDDKQINTMMWMVFSLLVILVIANAFNSVTCDFQWPDVGLAGEA